MLLFYVISILACYSLAVANATSSTVQPSSTSTQITVVSTTLGNSTTSAIPTTSSVNSTATKTTTITPVVSTAATVLSSTKTTSVTVVTTTSTPLTTPTVSSTALVTTPKQCPICPQYEFKFKTIKCECSGTEACQIKFSDEPQLKNANYTILAGLYILQNETFVTFFDQIIIMFTNHSGRIPTLYPDCIEPVNITLAKSESGIYSQPVKDACQLNTPGNFYKYNGDNPRPTRENLSFCNATVLNSYIPLEIKDNSDKLVKYTYKQVMTETKCNDKTKLSFYDYEIAVIILIAILFGISFTALCAPKVLTIKKKKEEKWHPY
uniref:Uncharacterized protein n=1 Tax=Guangdong mandarin rat snake torovirus TaxID=2116382 RepID=A0A2P1GNL2_9NIDO|nr:hypothetical protein [Guangdong mandarin rat snake torovirus]